MANGQHLTVSDMPPSWNTYRHHADDGDQPTCLYRSDDKLLLKAVGFYRTSDMDVEELILWLARVAHENCGLSYSSDICTYGK